MIKVHAIKDGWWMKVKDEVLLQSKLCSLKDCNLLIKINDWCFCGNDEVWVRCDGKKRFWIHDILSKIWNQVVIKGRMSRADFWNMSVVQAVSCWKTHSVLGGEFE